MSSPLCADKQPSAGGRGRGHAAPGCSCRRGAGVPGGPRAPRPAAGAAFRRRGRPLSSHDPGLPGARPAATSTSGRPGAGSQVSSAAGAAHPWAGRAHRRPGSLPRPDAPRGPRGAPPPPGPGLLRAAPRAGLRAAAPPSARGPARAARGGRGGSPYPPSVPPSLRPAGWAAALPGPVPRPRPWDPRAPVPPLGRSCAQARAAGGRAAAGRGARTWASEAALRGPRGPPGAGREVAASARPGRRQSKAGDGARRVAHGQAQGMKGSLSSSDTAAASSGLPLPRP